MPSPFSSNEPDPAFQAMGQTTVQRLIAITSRTLDLTLVAGARGMDRQISSWDLNLPGLAFAGFMEAFPAHRIQVLGSNEMAYLASLSVRKRRAAIVRVLAMDPPCLIVTAGREPEATLIEACEAAGIPLLTTLLRTSEFSSRLIERLMGDFAPSVMAHGTLVHVFGLGVLISGKSGVGKSECSLELIARGHRLVADDIVIIKRIDASCLVGHGSEVLKHHMEIQGIGIVDIASLYGVGAILNESEIHIHIQLEKWKTDKTYERVGIENQYTRILGVPVPEYVIPIEPGRNLSIIVETVTLTQKMKDAGVNIAAQFNERLIERMVGATGLSDQLPSSLVKDTARGRKAAKTP